MRRAGDACVAVALAMVVLVTACASRDDTSSSAPTTTTAPPAVQPGPAAASFVGVAACAECHEREAADWRGSHHDLAMQVADETTVLGDFGGATLTHFGVTSTLLQEGGQVLRPHRRTGRQAGRLRGGLHVRRRPAAAVPGRACPAVAGRRCRSPGTRARGRGRTALVPPEPERAHPARRSAPLDRHLRELEPPVRRVPLDEPPQEIRGRRGSLRHDVVGARRRVRGVPRAGLEPRRLGAGGSPEGRATASMGLVVESRRPRRRALGDGCRRRASLGAARRAGRTSRSRPAAAATRGAAS